MRFKDYSGSERFRPLTAWAYFGYALLFAIPIIGWLLLLIFSLSTKNYNRRSFARSYLCRIFVAVLIVVIISSTAIGGVWFSELFTEVRENMPEYIREYLPEDIPFIKHASNPTTSPKNSKKPDPTPKETSTQKPKTTSTATAKPTTKPTATPTTAPTEQPKSIVEGIGVTPEFKKAMDEYEAYFDSYIEFMESFDAENSTYTQLMKYYEFLNQYMETLESFDDIGDDDLSDADFLYYTEVSIRIHKKLITIDIN